MYTVKYLTENGWKIKDTWPDATTALNDFDLLAQYYKYVAVIQTETTTTETTIRESASES